MNKYLSKKTVMKISHMKKKIRNVIKNKSNLRLILILFWAKSLYFWNGTMLILRNNFYLNWNLFVLDRVKIEVNKNYKR